MRRSKNAIVSRGFAEDRGVSRRRSSFTSPRISLPRRQAGALLRATPRYWILMTVVIATASCNTDGPSPPKTPQQELKTFQIEEGFKVQLVASEPMVEDPVFITFDEDSRLWVVEMRGFMPDVDGNGEDQRIGRISILQDTTGDGFMDISTVFIDQLIMPRALAVVKGGALFVEDQKLWFSPDADGNLVADSKHLIDSTYGGPPLPEHSPNGLFRGIDNWYYNAKSAVRYKRDGNNWIRDSIEFRGQWGMSHDDQGRLFYNYNWSQLHADLVPPNYLNRNPHHTSTTGIDHGVTLDRRVYPIRSNPAVNRGYIPGTLDDRGRLLEFTAACSPFVYRAHAFPDEYYGNAFVAEPSGNLVKRNVVREDSGRLQAHDPHPGTEFMASTDERFRPVSIASGPDGALYITDMYRGLVQHEKYVTPYLREQTLKRGLEQPLHYGRIWRVVPENWKQPEAVIMSSLSPEDLVPFLASSNGWTRDMAQRLLTETDDEIPISELMQVATYSENNLQRIHALWALEGYGIEQPGWLRSLINDKDDAVASTALRQLEPFAANNENLAAALGVDMAVNAAGSMSYPRQLQYALSSHAVDRESRVAILFEMISRRPDSALMRDAVISSLTNEELTLLTQLTFFPEWREPTQGKEIFIESLTMTILRRRKAYEIDKLLKLVVDTKDNWYSKPMITALTTAGILKSPISLSQEPLFLTNGQLDSRQVEKFSAIFEWPGHKVDKSPSANSQLNDTDLARFAEGRKLYLTSCASCHGSDGAGMKRLAPTLIGSDWVLGDERRLALLVLHGLEGPIDVAGKRYDIPDILPVMPSHSTLDDGAITSILIYIRNEWGNNAGTVSPRTVGQTRHLTQGRVQPWTVDELNKHIADSIAIQ
jgi:mono/diheme cytochrome c family protein/glucose/arabinose dehydrogenase